jgi:radical SAM protein with 4Fe4S-binding SPASM domain
MCPHTIMKRKGKNMKLGEFKKILDNVLQHYKIRRLVISGFGEPFIDKEIVDKIKYANKKYPKLEIEIYTNASLLTKEMADELLKTNVKKITFSINATKKNYKKVMGLDYENTKNNVLYFLNKKKELKKGPLTNLSLMILKENETDIENFMNMWKPLADSVRIYSPSDWAKSLKVETIQQAPFKNKRWPCFALWGNITVDVEGNVVMCCRDYESRVKFGNLLKEDIKEIRNSKKYKDLQKKQLAFNFSTPICKNCDNSFDSSLDWVC